MSSYRYPEYAHHAQTKQPVNLAAAISAALMPIVSLLLILSVAGPLVWSAVGAVMLGIVATALGVAGLADRRQRDRGLAVAATAVNGVLALVSLVLLALAGWLT